MTKVDSSGFSRRSFMQVGGLTSLATLGLTGINFAQDANETRKLRLVFVGAAGRGGHNEWKLSSHPRVEFVGFCDVDRKAAEEQQSKYPQAFITQDYRELFASYADQFDAVVVSTADHMHAPITLAALAADKHVYCEKPLVHQLDELRMISNAVAAKPHLVTQMGNQRSCNQAKMGLAHALQQGLLGEVHQAWVSIKAMEENAYNLAPWSNEYPAAEECPEHIDWDLWLGSSCANVAYNSKITPRRWRSFWEFGLGPLGDWGAHILDTIFYGLDIQQGPVAVRTNAPKPAALATLGTFISSELFYENVAGARNNQLKITCSDGLLLPNLVAHGVPANTRVGDSVTMIETDMGTIITNADGNWRLFAGGENISAELQLPQVERHDHWHDWVDNCLGANKHLWSPFDVSARITEAALLAVRGSRFPGKDLLWDAERTRFIRNDEANETIVSREYRDGFGVPAEFA